MKTVYIRREYFHDGYKGKGENIQKLERNIRAFWRNYLKNHETSDEIKYILFKKDEDVELELIGNVLEKYVIARVLESVSCLQIGKILLYTVRRSKRLPLNQKRRYMFDGNNMVKKNKQRCCVVN